MDLPLHMADAPELLEEVISVMSDKLREAYRLAAKAPIPYVVQPDNITSPAIGEARFRKYVLPLYQELAGSARRREILFTAHMDGDLKPLWKAIGESGLKGIDSLSPPPDNDTSPGEALKMWPEMRLMMNFPSSVHLQKPEAIYRRAMEILEEGRAQRALADPDFRERAAGGVADELPGDRAGDSGFWEAVGIGRRSRMKRVILAMAMVVFSACAAGAQGTRLSLGLQGTGSFVFTDLKGNADRPLAVWYYTPAACRRTRQILIVMHGVHRTARTYRNDWITCANQYRFLLIVPEFSAEAYPGNHSYNYGNTFDTKRHPLPKEQWTYSAIEHLFDQVKAMTGNQSATYYLYGHSAGGQFVHRMMMFLPEARVQMAIATNPGHYLMPSFNEKYPNGLKASGIGGEQLKAAFAKNLVILIGEQDTDEDDPDLAKTEAAMAQGNNRWERAHTFFGAAQMVASDLGAKFNWTLRSVPGAHHSDRQMAEAAAGVFFGGNGY